MNENYYLPQRYNISAIILRRYNTDKAYILVRAWRLKQTQYYNMNISHPTGDQLLVPATTNVEFLKIVPENWYVFI